MSLGFACQSKTLTLGDAPGRLGLQLGSPRRIPELAWSDKAQNPSLSDDARLIYFTSTRGNTKLDVWRGERASTTEPFAAVERVDELSSGEMDTSTALSGDGLSIWFGSGRDGGLGDTDIWVAHRASREARWDPPQNAAALNTPQHDIPRPPTLGGLVLLVGSDRDAPGTYDAVYLATRAETIAEFEAPRAGATISIGTLRLDDPFLTNDGLTLLFSSDSLGGNADLFVATRASVDDDFTSYRPLSELNTAFAEHDPFLTADGSRFYFSSDRDGPLNIYDAEVLAGP